jgi:hypothetical protein
MYKAVKVIKYLAAILFLIALVILAFRFLGTKEDDWICQNGQWVKHGNPSSPMPEYACEAEND